MFELIKLVFEVDNNFAIKPCGRDACIKLIQALSELYPEEYFGCQETGIMDVDTVIKYARKEVSKWERKEKMK